MAETANQGIVASNEPGSRFDNIRLTPQNLAFNASDAITPGLRDEGTWEVKEISGKDIANRDKLYQHEVSLTFTTEQIKPLYFANYIQLARGYVDAQFKSIGGGSTSMGWLTFINNAAGFGVQATGTTSLAMKFKLTIGKSSNCVLTLSSYITSLLSTDELDFLFTSSGAALAANTGGTTLGLTAEAYDRASLIPAPGLESVLIQNSVGTGYAGKLGMESEITFESYSGATDNRNRAFVQGVRCGGKLRFIDMNKTQAKAYLTNARQDLILMDIVDKAGFTNEYTLGAVSFAPNWRISEKPGDSWVEADINGDIPVNPGGYTDVTYMDVGQTTATKSIWKGKIGYN